MTTQAKVISLLTELAECPSNKDAQIVEEICMLIDGKPVDVSGNGQVMERSDLVDLLQEIRKGTLSLSDSDFDKRVNGFHPKYAKQVAILVSLHRHTTGAKRKKIVDWAEQFKLPQPA